MQVHSLCDCCCMEKIDKRRRMILNCYKCKCTAYVTVVARKNRQQGGPEDYMYFSKTAEKIMGIHKNEQQKRNRERERLTCVDTPRGDHLKHRERERERERLTCVDPPRGNHLKLGIKPCSSLR